MLELLKNIFAIKKYFQEITRLEFNRPNQSVSIDGELFSFEYLKDLQTQINYINNELKDIIKIIQTEKEKEIL